MPDSSEYKRLVTAIAAMTCVATAALAAAELQPDTLRAFERYVRVTEARMDGERGARFLWIDRAPAAQRADLMKRTSGGEVVVERLETLDGGKTIDVPSGMIHHWVAATFVPGATLAETVALAQDYDRHADIFQPAVVRSKLRERSGDRFAVSFRFVQKRVITVVLDVDSDARFVTLDPSRVDARVYGNRIREVENAGTPQERVGPPDDGHGYLWRLNTYCRFHERDGGVLIEFETISLTRDLPFGVGWIVKPFITSLPRESLVFTLETYQKVLRRKA